MTALAAKHSAPPFTTVWGARLEADKETWDRYTLGQQIAKGGMGAVYEIFPEYRPALVAKLFGDKMIARMKGDPKIARRLAALVKHRAEINKGLDFATWPRRMLFSKERPKGTTEIANTIIGFTMPRLERTISLQELLFAPDRKLRLTSHDTIFIAITIADQLNKLHSHDWGFVFGDLSPNNVHVATDFKKVTFIDTDSFQFNFQAEQYTFNLQGLTDGYKSPGVDDQLRMTGRVTPAHDDFVLAILIFMLLMMDKGVPRHPFQSMQTPLNSLIAKRAFPFDNPHTYPLPQNCKDAYAKFTPQLRAAFTRTFTTPRTVTAAEWTQILHEYRRCLRPR